MFDPMTPQTSTTNILSTFGQHQQIIQPQYGLTTDTKPMFTYSQMSNTISLTEFIAPNVAFNNDPPLMFPQPTNLAEKFHESKYLLLNKKLQVTKIITY